MRTKRAESFFTLEEKEKVRQEIVAAETNTCGEIAIMMVDHSDDYREAECTCAILFAGLLALLIAIAADRVTIWSYIPMLFLFFLPARYVVGLYPPLKLAFLARKRVVEAVRDRAVRAFFEKGLYRTRGETGILIFISLLERKVWILGDRGINEKIAPDSWQNFAGELAKGIGEGNPCEAVCSVIAKCGEVLRLHFPVKANDIDELPDELITQ